MADEKNIPVKELDDGRVMAAVEAEEDPFDEDKKDNEKEAEIEVEASDANDSDESGDADGSDDEDAETDEDRQRIREARREERRLKKELAKQREASAKHKISALERKNEELARRLAAVENAATSYQFAQVDKAIEDEATRVEYAKMKLLQAAQSNDAASQVEYLEQLQEAKNRLAGMQAYKKQQLDQVKQPPQNVPTPRASEMQELATGWLQKNKWYDPQARDTDSRIAKVIDQELAADGWDPADPEYWDELDNRLAVRLPHRYAARTGTSAKRVSPTASSRTANPSAKSANTITLSRERVQAIKDAGAWDDPTKRNAMIKAYAAYDRQNRG
jgi:hypothetical protein